jgi:hypothetical protein
MIRAHSTQLRMRNRRGEWHMPLGVGNIVALVCIVISIIFALVTHEALNPLWWVLLAIFAVLWWGSKAPWGRD